MVLVEGQSPMNWPTNPRSAKAKAILIGCSEGRSISGIASNFLTNFGMLGATGLKPGVLSNRWNASAAEEGTEGGESPPPGVAMAKPYSAYNALQRLHLSARPPRASKNQVSNSQNNNNYYSSITLLLQ